VTGKTASHYRILEKLIFVAFLYGLKVGLPETDRVGKFDRRQVSTERKADPGAEGRSSCPRYAPNGTLLRSNSMPDDNDAALGVMPTPATVARIPRLL
jgi:hypothetical protein